MTHIVVKWFDLNAEPVEDPRGGFVDYPSQICIDTNPKFKHLLSAQELVVLQQADENATLRAERDEAVRLLEEAFAGFTFRESTKAEIESWRGKVFEFFTRKVKP